MLSEEDCESGTANWRSRELLVGLSLVLRSGPIAISHFTGLLVVLYLVLKIPRWLLLILYQPDLVYWLEAAAIVVLLKGLLEIALVWQVFCQTY